MDTMIKSIYKSNFEDTPIAIAGISLGFMSIATALIEFNITWVRHLAVIFSSACILMLVLKTILHPNKVINELKNPLAGSIYPTISMTLMLISVYLVKLSPQVAKLLWLGAIILHLLFFIIFSKYMLKSFKISNMLPSWFIPTVGIGLASVTSKPMGMPFISNVIFFYSLILFVILGCTMIYRVLFMGKLEGPKRFTLMIMTAPANICLAGYLAVSESPNALLLTVLAVLGYFSILYSFVLLPKLINTPFSLALAPLTFPLGIGVTAAQRYVKYLGNNESGLNIVLKYLLYVQVAVAVAVIGYIVVSTIRVLFKRSLR